MKESFRRFAHWAATAAGSAWTFFLALLSILLWLLAGPAFHYSDTWQLVINTGTTIITFLMVFLIQNTQNRDARAMHLKIDELLRTSKARNWLVQLEDMPEAELDRVQEEFAHLIAKRRRTKPPPKDETKTRHLNDKSDTPDRSLPAIRTPREGRNNQ
jgi:low affinity Fe/Cu permease